MPRYFIDVTDGDRVYRDQSGSIMPDVSQARSEAVDTLVDLFRRDLYGRDERTASTVIRNSLGQIVYEATLAFRVMKIT